jgi:hypothetical protein
MSHCSICCTRFDACSECHAQEIAKRDAEIARLRAVLKDCHDNVYQRKELATLVDFYYHEFFMEAEK